MPVGQHVRHDQTGNADRQLRESVQTQGSGGGRFLEATDEATNTPRTETHTGHEHGENDRYHRRRYPELCHRQTQPNDFVNKTAET